MNKMIDFNQYLEDKQIEYNIQDIDFRLNISRFLVSNNWFNQQPTIQNNSVYIDENALQSIDARIAEFCNNYNKDDKQKTEYLLRKLAASLPKTSNIFRRYMKSVKLDEKSSITLIYKCSFILSFLENWMNPLIMRWLCC